MDLFWQTVLGIATGVVTSALLFFLKDLWVKILRPYVEELRYNGVSVGGTWRGYSRDEFHDSDMHLRLAQSALRITGTFNFRFRSAQKQFTIDYDVTGYLWEGYLTLNFRPVDKSITTSATGLFKIAGGGAALAGQFCFRNVELEAVTPLFITMARVSGGLLPGATNLPSAPAADAPAPAAIQP